MTGDQQWPTYDPGNDQGGSGHEPVGDAVVEGSVEPDPDETAEPSTWLPVPIPPYGAAQALEPASLPKLRRPGGGGGMVGAIVVGVIALAVIGGIAAGIGGIVAATGGDVPGFSKPDAQSAEGLADLVDDVEERTGGSELFHAVIYPEYASVDLPVDARSQRYETSYWDGDLSEDGSKGTSSYGRFDLADVDAQVMQDAIDVAKSLVEDPNSWYASIGTGFVSSGEKGGRPTISAYASNEYSESVYVEVYFNGTEVLRYVDGEVVEPEKEK